MEMKELLSDHSEGIMFPQITSQYKAKFGKELKPSNYGFTKLVKVLEAIPDIVKVSP